MEIINETPEAYSGQSAKVAKLVPGARVYNQGTGEYGEVSAVSAQGVITVSYPPAGRLPASRTDYRPSQTIWLKL